MHRLKMKISFILICVGCLYFPPCCSAQDLPCTVSWEANGQTTYGIPVFNHSGCHFSWISASDIVLATQGQKKHDKVLFKNRTTLTTSTCMETVCYRRDCISEGIVRKATCNTTCTAPAGLGADNGPNTWHILGGLSILAILILGIGIVIALFHNNTRARARDFLRRLHSYLPACLRMNYTPTPGQPKDDRF